jgi:hypothetical protein
VVGIDEGKIIFDKSEIVRNGAALHIDQGIAVKVALREAVARPSKRLSSWEFLEGAEKDRALKAELDSQRAKAQKEQQESIYER